MSKARKNMFKGVLKAPLYLFVAWALGFMLFWARLPAPLEGPPPTAEAIVVLTGGPDRLEAGVELLVQKYAPRMLVSGVHKDVVPHELSALTGGPDALFECCVTLGYEANNTLENAIETAKWTTDNKINSILLITADYHIQRSVVLFRKSMPDVTTIPYPVKSDMPVFKLAKEYNKYLATLILELVGY